MLDITKEIHRDEERETVTEKGEKKILWQIKERKVKEKGTRDRRRIQK